MVREEDSDEKVERDFPGLAEFCGRGRLCPRAEHAPSSGCEIEPACRERRSRTDHQSLFRAFSDTR